MNPQFGEHLLLAPTPFIDGSIKLLYHEVVNFGLLCWVLGMQITIGHIYIIITKQVSFKKVKQNLNWIR